MQLTFIIDVSEGGVRCSGTANGADAYANAEANVIAIGALEIARASLLAHRWGVNISGRETKAIVEEPADDDALCDPEKLIAACVPGGSICDPQQVADAIRAFMARRTRK